MSDSDEEEDLAIFGTPLELFEEDAVPRKKPLTIEEQIATDRHGKRRFHGAFTGGFSAGFFNSVGSLEGWKPSTFRSSRNERSKVEQQLPKHFMDDEDVEEFGIAPQILTTKPEYSSNSRNNKKRGREIPDSGPIPGEPVLKTILKPANHTMGIILLMKMGWKPGNNIGEKLKKKVIRLSSKTDNKTSSNTPKVYGCARGPEQSDDSQKKMYGCSQEPDHNASSFPDQSSSDDEDEIYRELGEKAPSFIMKEDTMGLGYKGLDRNALKFDQPKGKMPLTLRDQFNKTIKISGQAFGVGAFEDEDEDIYSTDDKSQYDFCLEPLNSNSKRSKNAPAITDGSKVIIGFVKASFKDILKTYPGPIVPASFTGRHVEKKSRFDVRPSGQRVESSRQKLDANTRSAIINMSVPTPVSVKEEKQDVIERINNTEEQSKKLNKDNSWKPFASDPIKQERYEKYLNLIKIGAKDLVHTVLMNTMSDLERESELREFEAAARLYSGSIMSDRFTHGGEFSEVNDNCAKVDKIDKNVRRRITSDWSPHIVVCKRFNIKPPDNASQVSLLSVAESSKKPKFSVFDFLNASKTANLSDLVESNTNRETVQDRIPYDLDRDIKCEIIDSVASSSKQQDDSNLVGIDTEQNTDESTADLIRTSSGLHISADDDEFEEPADKMDLFKAIFLDSDEEEESNVNEQDENNKKNEVVTEPINVLRNTSPPRGIFANLDLDKLSNRNIENNKPNEKQDVLQLTAIPKSIFETEKTSSDLNKNIDDNSDNLMDNCYGPSLPSVPIEKPKSYVNLKLDVVDDYWIEKSSKSKTEKTKESKDKHRHKSHKKKHKKEKKKDHKKKKKKKKKKKYSSSSSSTDSSD